MVAASVSSSAGPAINLSRFTGEARIRGPSWLQLPLLTVSFFGFQLVWSMEMSYGIPFLLELGLSKAAMAIVFIAGPISGLVVQPVVGVLADKSTHPWGRRRPFMLTASAMCCIFLLLFGYARVLPEALSIPAVTPVIAVIGIWGMDFAINAVMALDRSLVFDMLPANQQAAANAWSMRMSAFGSILGFYVGDLDLPSCFPFVWLPFLVKDGTKTPTEPQVRCLSLVTSFCLVASHLLVTWAAIERRLKPNLQPEQRVKPMQMLTQSMQDFVVLARQLPHSIRQVFWIQIASWISWFPLMFYTTAWVSSIATEAHRIANGDREGEKWDQVQANGTRAGSHALFLQAVIAFACSALLPLLLPYEGTPKQVVLPSGYVRLAPSRFPYSAQRWLEDTCHGLAELTRDLLGPQQRTVNIGGGISLATLWVVAHAFIVTVTWLTWPVHASHSLGGATAIIALSGYSSAVSNWAPFAIIGILIRSDDSTSQESDSPGTRDGGYEALSMLEARDEEEHGTTAGSSQALEIQGEGEADDGSDAQTQNQPPGSQHPRSTHSRRLDPDETSARTGSILGLHNTAIVIPQMIVSLAAAIVFALFDDESQKHRGQSDSRPPSSGNWDVVGLMIRISGLSSILAAWLTWKLHRQYGHVIDASSDALGDTVERMAAASAAPTHERPVQAEAEPGQ